MATKKRPAKRRKSRKKSGSGKRIWLSLFIVLGLAGAAFLFYWYGVVKRPLLGDTLHASLEGVLVAGGLDLDRTRKVAFQDGIERWKIDLPSETKKKAVMRGMRRVVRAHGGIWSPGRTETRDGMSIQIVDIKEPDDEMLRLILVIGLKKPAVAEKPDPEPDPAKPIQPSIAIILDDIGQREIDHLKPVLDLKFPITFAVLPYLPYSGSNAVYLHQNQYEVMLHLPMEPEGYPKNDPGKGAVFSYFNEREIRKTVNRALESVPFIKGVNNHMGSKVTTSKALMRPILEEIKKKDLFYIDSRTDIKTVAYRSALNLGMQAAKRDVFLDSEMTYDFVVRQLGEARKIADKTGAVVVIGHPYPTTLKALADELPKMDKNGYRFVFASSLVKRLKRQM